jgi:hypothetical protein
MFKTIWEKIKASLGPVGSIIEARVTALSGLAIAGVGFMDWAPLTSLFGTGTAFNKTQVMALGAIAFVKGIFSEITRRANDPFLKISQTVDAAPAVAQAKKRVKKIVDETPVTK